MAGVSELEPAALLRGKRLIFLSTADRNHMTTGQITGLRKWFWVQHLEIIANWQITVRSDDTHIYRPTATNKWVALTEQKLFGCSCLRNQDGVKHGWGKKAEVFRNNDRNLTTSKYQILACTLRNDLRNGVHSSNNDPKSWQRQGDQTIRNWITR